MMIKCENCGKMFDNEKYDSNAFFGNNCFDCSFWLQKIHMSEEDKARRVVVDGNHYMIGPEDEDNCMRGHGGRKFVISFFDGRVIETRNLWTQGKIDDEFRTELPDNAVFVWDHVATTKINGDLPF